MGGNCICPRARVARIWSAEICGAACHMSRKTCSVTSSQLAKYDFYAGFIARNEQLSSHRLRARAQFGRLIPSLSD